MKEKHRRFKRKVIRGPDPIPASSTIGVWQRLVLTRGAALGRVGLEPTAYRRCRRPLYQLSYPPPILPHVSFD